MPVKDRPSKRLSATERRARIEEAAMRTFAQRGYQAASMVEIAAAADITPAVVYDHFPSKAVLHNGLLERELDRLLSATREALDAAPADVGARLRAGVEVFYAFVESDRFAWRFLFRDPANDPEVAACHVRVQDKATRTLGVFFRTRAPEAFPDDPNREQTTDLFAHLIKVALNGGAAWWYEHPEIPRRVMVERTLQFCWQGLERTVKGDAST